MLTPPPSPLQQQHRRPLQNSFLQPMIFNSAIYTTVHHCNLQYIPATIEEESARREGQGCHCWLWDRIDSIRCRTRDLALGRFEEKDEYIEERTLGRMDAWEKWMIIRFTPHQTTTRSKWMFFQKLFCISSLLQNG